MKLGVATLALLCGGCALLGPANEPASARVLRLLGQAVVIEDNICAQVAADQQDQKLADTCAAIYAGERAGLLAAASAIDAGNEGDAMCAVLDVAKGLRQINDELLNRGVEEPALIKQALAAADALAPLCSVP